ncbi:ABC transporter ATP-binding protein [Oscillibacter sp.]|jgi:iron(III) transport system ATP-binding protein|uniref:ABC transporter ATP-binding protein n=1 Tax=Oscillibacter sp. TaxID=1945593 RepID=UPI00216B8FE8|nr:ABC transporter ATP-binding protein [Oscillibacter sp.]MCI9648304.1 ABC transporter ATP-binding protein [Oscillibacter sp.]
MSKITIKNAVKRYGSTTVISGLNLDIRDGELFTLLGPSGCGKTTLLRMIAGFNSIEGGDFYFNEERINDKDPSKRNIGMVFQNYAIFPHMTVRENVAFGLKNRKLDKAVIKRESDRFLEMMQIDQYADRLPENLSGGQQQRVALARALVIKPDVLLMDEPLSNLDAKLRLEMRQAIRSIQKEVGITTVYVTHDQEEAMSISDTIAVMKSGSIQHLGAPRDIYQRPSNLFVATFIGRTNVLPAALRGGELVFPSGYAVAHSNWSAVPDQPVKVSVRPEEFIIGPNGGDSIPGTVVDSIYLGLNTHYIVDVGLEEPVELIQESAIDDAVVPGSRIGLTVKKEKINIYDEQGDHNLLRG